MTLSKAVQAERAQARAEAIDDLRKWLPPGSKVRTVLRHVSRSGMRRSISPIIMVNGSVFDATWHVSRAIGWNVHQRHYGLIVDGAGMDMGFHLVYTLSRVLYSDGFECIGRDHEIRRLRCPANDHVNPGDKDKTYHQDGGYALRHDWL